MSNIIDNTYFVRDVDIPVSSTEALNGSLNDSISLYEPEVLKLLLGYSLWKEMQASYNASVATVPVPLITKWDRLINGAEFSFNLNGVTIKDKWEGLKNTSKVSLIANYVYYWHRRNNISQNSGIGETVSKSENSTVINPRYKMKNAWNKFVDLYGELGYCGTDNTTYTHWNDKPSAYNFLLANIADYPTWRFEPQEKMYSL